MDSFFIYECEIKFLSFLNSPNQSAAAAKVLVRTPIFLAGSSTDVKGIDKQMLNVSAAQSVTRLPKVRPRISTQTLYNKWWAHGRSHTRSCNPFA